MVVSLDERAEALPEPKAVEVIGDLAQLSNIVYEQCRVNTAKELGVRVTVLDAEVEKLRPKAPEEEGDRPIKYLNNIIEQDHRFTKRRIWYSQWLQTFKTAEATISGYESMHMIRKGQIEGIGRKDALAQKKFIEELFGVAA